jgi:hypothetical protein
MNEETLGETLLGTATMMFLAIVLALLVIGRVRSGRRIWRTPTLVLIPEHRSQPTSVPCAVGRSRPIRDEAASGRRDGNTMNGLRKSFAAWKPAAYSLTILATLVMAAGAKWRPN